MKINPRFLLVLLTAASLSAAPLTKPTTVHAKPDLGAPAIALLGAGTEPALAPAATAPDGWTAVELAGPHEVYVQNKDIMKSLDVRPGAPFYTAPKVDSAVLTTMVKGDPAEISGLHGRWTQIRLRKNIVGYIPTGASAAQALVAPAPAYSSPVSASPVVASAGPVVPAAAGAPAAPRADNSAAALPRLFEGSFVPAKRFLAYKPYDYQLNDRTGERYAFLDLSRLRKDESPDRYLNRTVIICGTARPIPNTKDIVIDVESIQIQ